MICGETNTFKHLEPVFAALAPGADMVPPTKGRSTPSSVDSGYLHCGPHGAGHFVNMIHNGIEYGMMAAYAEGMNILHKANIGKHERENKDRKSTRLNTSH